MHSRAPAGTDLDDNLKFSTFVDKFPLPPSDRPVPLHSLFLPLPAPAAAALSRPDLESELHALVASSTIAIPFVNVWDAYPAHLASQPTAGDPLQRAVGYLGPNPGNLDGAAGPELRNIARVYAGMKARAETVPMHQAEWTANALLAAQLHGLLKTLLRV